MCAGPCGRWGEREHFTKTQWAKGERRGRCEDCTERASPYVKYDCTQCSRSFDTQNNLNMHMITHRPKHQCYECGRAFDSANELRQHGQVHLERNVACPLCGEVRFRSVTNAVAHVESGSCQACQGADNARRNIYDYMSSNATGRRFLSDTLAIDNGSGRAPPPDRPYQCNLDDCGRSGRTFVNLSALMAHQADKHGADQFGSMPLLGGGGAPQGGHYHAPQHYQGGYSDNSPQRGGYSDSDSDY